MALLTRLSRLFQADFHAVLDHIEEPDLQLKQAVREMEFDLQQDEAALALLAHEIEQLLALIDESKNKVASFDDELDICFSAKKETLARDLIRRKLETGSVVENAEKRLNSMRQQNQTLQQRIQQHRQQLDNMHQKLALLVEESSSPNYQNQVFCDSSRVRNEDIEIAYLREKQKRIQA